jgi:hypothetical protein
MAEDYTRDELCKLYEVLPKELKEAIFSQVPKIEIKEILKERKIPTIGEILGLRKTSKEDK